MLSVVSKFFGNKFKIWWLQVLTLTVNFGFAGLMYVHFFKKDIHIGELFLAEFFFHLLLFLVILLKGSFLSRYDIRLGYVIGLVAFSLLFLPFSRPVMYAYFIIRGIGGIMFYIPYNILYFEQVKKETRVRSMTFYWVLGLTASVVAPLIGGAIIKWFGFYFFILAALLLLCFGIWMTRFVDHNKYSYSFKEVLGHIKGLRVITVIDGSLHKIIGIVTPIFALYYLQNEWEYGRLLAIFGLISGLATLLLARRLDKTNQRMVYIWPLTMLMGMVTSLFYFIDTFGGFLITMVFLQVLTVMTEPLRGNILQDVLPKSPLVWISRELYLTLGRGILFGLVALLLFFDLKKELFLIFALLNFIYPFLLVYKKVYAPAY